MPHILKWVGITLLVLAVKGGGSVALGVLLTPIAAIIPWIELGLGEDSACHD